MEFAEFFTSTKKKKQKKPYSCHVIVHTDKVSEFLI